MFKVVHENISGIYFLGNTLPVSFPNEGYDICFNVEDESYWFKHRNKCICELFQFYSFDKNVIDIGGGNGVVSKYLQDKGFEVTLIEPGIEACYNARKRGLKNIYNGLLDHHTFIESSLSNIGSFDVIEHILDPKDFIQNIYDALLPGGIFILTVPAYDFLWSDEDRLAGHFRRYTLKTIIHDVERSGFKTVYSTHIFSLLVFPIFVFRRIPFLFSNKRKTNKSIKKAENEHISRGLFSVVINLVLKVEFYLLTKKIKIPFGSSCLVVFRK